MSKSTAMKNKKNIINKENINSLNKYYNIAKILLTLTPFMSLMYISMESAKVGLPMSEVIQTDPKLTILFLVSMVNPFIAYLLTFIQKKIDENDVEYAVTNLFIFVIAEILLQNVLYAILFGFILHKTLKAYNRTIKKSFEVKLKNGFLMANSGSLIVIFLAGICLFATIRINM